MEIGTIVLSKKGRDINRYYIIISIVDSKLVKVVDGNIRKLSNPKNKNIKHLKEISILDSIKNKINNNQQIFDKEINKAINLYINSLNK